MLRIFARFYGIKNPILAFKSNRTSIIYTNYMAHNAYRSTEKGNVYPNTRSYSNNNVLSKQEKMSHKVRVLTKRH